jgi:hypothetical membrane protein
MNRLKIVKTFTDRYPNIGPTIWILSIQYYVIQVVAALVWKMPYSIRFNTISDLGNTACGEYGVRYICSPLNPLMNLSFITLGTTMAVGSLLIYQEFKESVTNLVGFLFMALAGFGTILVGIFPENSTTGLHEVGAALPFLIGNIGLVVLAASLNVPKWLRIYTVLSGMIALIGLDFFLRKQYLGLGIGGMERIAAYPQTIWLIVFGMYISRNHVLHTKKR